MSFNPQENFELVRSLNELRLQNTGCDVVLQVGQRSFFAHRVVLMARMGYFRNMLTADMRERKELVVPLDPEVIDPAVFGDILEYIYVFRVQFTPHNFQPICKAADFFCFDELQKKAKDYMKESLKPEAVEPFMNIATGNSSKELEEECERLLISNPSSEIARKLLIPSLSAEYLKLLMNKMTTLLKHEDVFHYCIDWILHDQAQRKDKLAELLKSIPLESLPTCFLKNVVLENFLVSADNQSLKLLASALVKKNSSERLFVFGGRDEGVLSSVSEYEPISGEWILSKQMSIKLAYHDCTVIGNNIYFCGGDDGINYVCELQMFNPQTNELKKLQKMNAKQSCGVVAVSNCIYIAGGRSGDNLLSTMERYSIQTDQLELMTPMNHKRAGFALTKTNGYLYAIGGWVESKQFTSSVERYDPIKNEWTDVASMNNPRGWFGSAVYEGKIYVVGTKLFEVYDPITDKWQVLASPTDCSLGRRLAVFNDRIYSIGGSTGVVKDCKGVKTVEYFDFEKQIWIRDKDMDIARCYHSVAVVKN